MLPKEQYLRAELANTLDAIEQSDGADADYETRNRLAWQAMAYASQLGYMVGVSIDPKEPDRPVCMIELPTGQVSWRTPAAVLPWDGHTTEEKYRRCQAYAARVRDKSLDPPAGPVLESPLG